MTSTLDWMDTDAARPRQGHAYPLVVSPMDGIVNLHFSGMLHITNGGVSDPGLVPTQQGPNGQDSHRQRAPIGHVPSAASALYLCLHHFRNLWQWAAYSQTMNIHLAPSSAILFLLMHSQQKRALLLVESVGTQPSSLQHCSFDVSVKRL